MLKQLDQSGLLWRAPVELADADLETRLYGPQGSKPRCRKLPEPGWSTVYRELERKHATLQILREEHAAEHTGGYKYSRFCDLYRGWEGRLLVAMRQTRLGSDKLFNHYARDKIRKLRRVSHMLWIVGQFVRNIPRVAYTIRITSFPLIRTEFFVVQRRSLALMDA